MHTMEVKLGGRRRRVEMLNKLKVCFVSDAGRTEPPIEVASVHAAFALIRNRYPDAFVEQWDLDRPQGDCITLAFHQSEAAYMEATLNPLEQPGRIIGAGVVFWFFRIVD